MLLAGVEEDLAGGGAYLEEVRGGFQDGVHVLGHVFEQLIHSFQIVQLRLQLPSPAALQGLLPGALSLALLGSLPAGLSHPHIHMHRVRGHMH